MSIEKVPINHSNANERQLSYRAPLRVTINRINATTHYGEVNVVNNVEDFFDLEYIIMFILLSKARTVSYL